MCCTTQDCPDSCAMGQGVSSQAVSILYFIFLNLCLFVFFMYCLVRMVPWGWVVPQRLAARLTDQQSDEITHWLIGWLARYNYSHHFIHTPTIHHFFRKDIFCILIGSPLPTSLWHSFVCFLIQYLCINVFQYICTTAFWYLCINVFQWTHVLIQCSFLLVVFSCFCIDIFIIFVLLHYCNLLLKLIIFPHNFSCF